MKLSVSLTEDDVARLDKYVRAASLWSRPAGIQQAIRRLSDPALEEAYAAAWDDWEASDDAAAWDVTAADGLADAAR